MEIVVSARSLELAFHVLGRVSGLLLVAPLLATSAVPRRTRVILTLALTAVLLPGAGRSPGAAEPGPNLLGRLLGEVALGASMGLVAELLFAALELASNVISFGSGLSYINAVDPTSPVRSTTIATFQWMLGAALFLSLDGHLLLLKALGASFELVPPGSADPGGLWSALWPASSILFGLGLVLAAPAILVLLIVDLGLGLVGRVLPQVQVLMIGMGIKPAAGLLALSLAYSALPRAFARSLDHMVLDWGRLVQAAVSR